MRTAFPGATALKSRRASPTNSSPGWMLRCAVWARSTPGSATIRGSKASMPAWSAVTTAYGPSLLHRPAQERRSSAMASRARSSCSSASRPDCSRFSSSCCAAPSELSAPLRSRSASRTSPICARISRMSSRRVAARAFEVTWRSSPESAGSPSRGTPARSAGSTRFRAGPSMARPRAARRHPGGDLIELMPGVGTQIGDVLDEESLDRSVGGGQVVVLLLDGSQVLEIPRRLLDQVFVDWAQARGEGVRNLARIEVLRQQRAAQGDQQVEQLGVPLAAEAEQPCIHGFLVRALPVAVVRVTAEDGGELLGRQRAGVGGQQAELDAHPLVGDVERRAGPVPVLVRRQADDEGDGLS